MSNPNDPLLEEVMKDCPEQLREELEVELIRRRNVMHDSGLKKFAISMHNIEFAKGAMFSYNLLATKIIDLVPSEGSAFVVNDCLYKIKKGQDGGVLFTKYDSTGTHSIEISIKVIRHNEINIS